MALLLHLVTDSAVWDSAASLLIGLLLIRVAFVLIRNGALLIDEAAPPTTTTKGCGRPSLRSHGWPKVPS